jgi:DNA adenine methylase
MDSFLSYMGGKSLLAKKIIPMIPPHTCYCEVFAGAAWILFRKEESRIEIINDINSDLVTLYRVVKHHLDEFIRYLRWILIAREEFERFKRSPPGRSPTYKGP